MNQKFEYRGWNIVLITNVNGLWVGYYSHPSGLRHHSTIAQPTAAEALEHAKALLNLLPVIENRAEKTEVLPSDQHIQRLLRDLRNAKNQGRKERARGIRQELRSMGYYISRQGKE